MIMSRILATPNPDALRRNHADDRPAVASSAAHLDTCIHQGPHDHFLPDTVRNDIFDE